MTTTRDYSAKELMDDCIRGKTCLNLFGCRLGHVEFRDCLKFEEDCGVEYDKYLTREWQAECARI